MKFYYSGVTRQKETVRGVVDAQDRIEAQMKLRSMQIRANSISEKPVLEFSLDSLKDFSIGPVIDLKGIMVFTRQFSSLIDSGVPVVQCLDILCQQETRRAFKIVLKTVKEDVESGSGLADALGKHPRAFSEFFIRIVEAGELSGTLDVALKRVGAQLEKLGKIKSKVIGALTYPAITIVVSIGTLIFLLVKVIPEVSKLYAESNAKLPDLTVTVLGLSAWFQEYWYAVFLGFGGSIAVFVALYQTNGFRVAFDPIVLKVPIIGPLIIKSNIAKLTRTLSTLISSGVPLIPSFEICVKLVENLAIKDSVRQTAQMVQEGKSIAQGFALKRLFPPMVIHMVNIGEMTGRLDELLGKVADIFDDEVDDAVNAVTGVLQPILIIFVGGLILFLLMAMYLPIFQLAEKTTGGA